MVFFQSAESAERNASTEAILSSGIRILEDAAVQEALGARASQLLTLAERTYVPNIKHGELRRPFGTAKDSLPVTSIFEGERLTLKDPRVMGQTEEQVERTRHYLTLQSDSEEEINTTMSALNIYVRTMAEPIQVGVIDNANAAVNYATLDVPINRRDARTIRRVVRLRPVTVFRAERKDNPISGIDAIHELTHVRQSLERTVYNPHPERVFRTASRQEFEAYQNAALASRALYKFSPNDTFRGNNDYIDIGSMIVDNARVRVNNGRQNDYSWSPLIKDIVDEDLEGIGQAPSFLSRPNISATIEPSQR